ncbi:MAG TPA: TSUP family transporter, partial [Acidimicrobiales bacterium]|nr:TSUP family transporter [Acidimicrobiales bacterium]
RRARMTIALSPLDLAGLLVLGVASGAIGAVSGVGGGVVIVPLLVVAFGIDFRVAVGVALIAVTANAMTACGRFIREGLTNKRVALTLEVATTAGGITGGLLTGIIARPVLEGIFAAAMFTSAGLVRRRRQGALKANEAPGAEGDQDLARALEARGLRGAERPGTLGGVLVEQGTQARTYQARRPWLGGSISYVAGVLSGLLGVGGGFLKVPAVNAGMEVPIRVTTATTEFMVGVTAVASLLVYFARGDVYPLLAAPVVLGVVGGSVIGSRAAGRLPPRALRRSFITLVVTMGVVIALRAVGVLPHG